MEKIQRITQKIFGGNAPSDDIAALGSFKAGTPIYTDDVASLQNEAYEKGFGATLVANEAPFMEEQNSIPYILSKQLAYLFQKGIPEWDKNTTYYANTSFCQVNGIIYQSLTDDNIGNNPVTDTTNWKIFLQPGANIDLSNLSSVGEKHFLNKTQITNCILEAPNGSASFEGTTITVKSGLKYLTANGRNADGTLKNAEFTLSEDKSINFAGIGNSTNAVVYIINNFAGYCPLSEVYRTSTKPAGNAASNQVWFDAANNKIYHSSYQSTDWVETTDFIITANLNVTDSVINSLVEEQPVELLKRSDTVWITHSIAPDFSYTVDLPKTLDLVQVADQDCYLLLITANNIDATIAACDANGENEVAILVADSTSLVAMGGLTCLLRKGQYFKLSYLANGIPETFKKIYTIGGTNV